MTESIEHKQLKTKARELLKEKYGFKDSEIFEEFNYILKNSVKIEIDVVGKNSERFVAVECGNTPKLKQVCMISELGKENVVLLPYNKIILDPLFYKEDVETTKKKIKMLKSIYNKYIFDKLKSDKDFGLFEYNEENKDYFHVGHIRGVWMAFPTKKNTPDGKKLQYEIGFTISYNDEEHYEISIGAETNGSINQFLSLSNNTLNKIVTELNKLPSNFETQDGIKYKTEKITMPPYLRNWDENEPVSCNRLSIEELEEIKKRLVWYLNEGSKFKEWPVFALVKTIVKKEELAKVIMILKPLFELSFKFRTEKQEKTTHDSIKSLKEMVRSYEEGFDEESSEEDYNGWKQALKKLESL